MDMVGWGAWCVLGVWAVVLAGYDVRARRLPNPLTVPPALAGVTACLIFPQVAVGLVWPVAYALAGRGIGGGDVKLAVPLGVVCAACGGFGAVLAAVALSGLCTVVVAGALRERRVAHGPSMLLAAGATVGVFGW